MALALTTDGNLLLEGGGNLIFNDNTLNGQPFPDGAMAAIARFRSDFSEFSDKTKFQDDQIFFYIALARQLISIDRLGEVWSFALELFVAHNLVLELAARRNALKSDSLPGMLGGGGMGVQTSKTVGSASVTYSDASNSQYLMEPGAGHWGLTVYGMRYLNLIRLFSTVCYHLPGSSYGPY